MRIPYYPQEYGALMRLGVPILIAQIGFTLQGMADTIMVGQHQAVELSAVGFVNSIMVLAIMLCMGFGQGAVALIAAAVYAFREDITVLFISDADAFILERVSAIVAATALPLILYQFGDGMQTAYVNALRGYGDVKVLMKYSFLAYVVISLPLSYLFGIIMDMGCFGIWMGFPFGLTTAAILYLIRFRKVTSSAHGVER